MSTAFSFRILPEEGEKKSIVCYYYLLYLYLPIMPITSTSKIKQTAFTVLVNTHLFGVTFGPSLPLHTHTRSQFKRLLQTSPPCPHFSTTVTNLQDTKVVKEVSTFLSSLPCPPGSASHLLHVSVLHTSLLAPPGCDLLFCQTFLKSTCPHAASTVLRELLLL